MIAFSAPDIQTPETGEEGLDFTGGREQAGNHGEPAPSGT